MFTCKGKPVNAKEIAADTGARYVLEGSVRKGGSRLRGATTQRSTALHRRPDHARAHAILAVALAHLGQFEAARSALAESETLDPDCAKKWTVQDGYKNQADNEHIVAGLRQAGCDV